MAKNIDRVSEWASDILYYIFAAFFGILSVGMIAGSLIVSSSHTTPNSATLAIVMMLAGLTCGMITGFESIK
jgi:hypothetical protein